MKNKFTVTVRTKPWPNPGDLYTIDVDGRELDVNQRCVDRLHDLVKGEWSAEFEDGEVIVYGSFKRGQPGTTCRTCGKPIPFMRVWCDPCLDIAIGYKR